MARYALRVEDDLYEKYKAMADATGRSVNSCINDAMEHYATWLDPSNQSADYITARSVAAATFASNVLSSNSFSLSNQPAIAKDLSDAIETLGGTTHEE